MNVSTTLLTSKLDNTFIYVVLIALCTSCSPSIQYLGDSYQSNYTIDVFYSENDVEREYKTIGKMTHDNMFDYEVDTIKDKMIEVAKRKGGDGIIFLDMKNERKHNHYGDILDEERISITAHVIRYKNS